MEKSIRVDAYRNLNRECFSILSRESGHNYERVIAWVSTAVLRDVEFVIQPGGQERARESGTRNVHAFARGEWYPAAHVHPIQEQQEAGVTYNPFEYDSFVDVETEQPIDAAEHVALTLDGVAARGVTYSDEACEQTRSEASVVA